MPLFDEFAKFADYLISGAGSFRTSCIRDDAVSAESFTAFLDFNECPASERVDTQGFFPENAVISGFRRRCNAVYVIKNL